MHLFFITAIYTSTHAGSVYQRSVIMADNPYANRVLLDLPAEIIMLICDHVTNHLDLQSLGSTCRSLYNIVHERKIKRINQAMRKHIVNSTDYRLECHPWPRPPNYRIESYVSIDMLGHGHTIVSLNSYQVLGLLGIRKPAVW